MKSFSELEEYYGMEVLTDKGYNEIIENENVESVTCNGESGSWFGKTWYTAYGTELDEYGYQKEFDFYMQTEKGK